MFIWKTPFQNKQKTLDESQLDCKANETFWRKDPAVLNEWISQFQSNETYSEFKDVNLTDVFAKPKFSTAEEYWNRRVLKLQNDDTDAGTEKYTMDNLGPVQD